MKTACLIITLLITLPSYAQTIRVAVAANFSPALRQLAPHFHAVSGENIDIIVGSSGALYAQIINGAPIDVFLSADEHRVNKLASSGLGIARSQVRYVRGKLVLWSPYISGPTAGPQKTNGANDSPETQSCTLKNGGALLRTTTRLAIANPQLAPYGAAAIAVINQQADANALKSALVQGNNVNQTFQFVASGSAPMGFIALSQVLALAEHRRGCYWLVPAGKYPPINQSAIIVAHSQQPQLAQQFLDFLVSAESVAHLRALGYDAGADIQQTDRLKNDK